MRDVEEPQTQVGGNLLQSFDWGKKERREEEEISHEL